MKHLIMDFAFFINVLWLNKNIQILFFLKFQWSLKFIDHYLPIATMASY